MLPCEDAAKPNPFGVVLKVVGDPKLDPNPPRPFNIAAGAEGGAGTPARDIPIPSPLPPNIALPADALIAALRSSSSRYSDKPYFCLSVICILSTATTEGNFVP